MENIDVDTAKDKGILCFNSPEGNRDALAEHTLGMLLMLFNKLHTANQEVKNGIWKREENRGVELKGRTVGLIGYGVMGKAFAQRLKGFDCSVVAYDKFKSNISDENAREVSWQEFTDQCDVVSLHVNYLPENEYLANESFFNQFKKPIYFINTARGRCLQTKALIEAIEKGKVLGACLDVIEFESISFENDYNNSILEELFNRNEVVFSPHVAGWTKESYKKLSEFLFKKINENINLINR
jgi:D-3-phosphoglycerate dehydrogenase